MPSTTTPYEGYIPVPQALGILRELAPTLPLLSDTIIRRAVKDGTIRAIRVGTHRVLVHQDDIPGLVTPVDRRMNERIRELIAAAPEPTDEQITRIRLIMGIGGGDDHAA